jgi:hypothetical protein
MQWKQIDKKKKQRTEALHDKVIGESRSRRELFQYECGCLLEHFNTVDPSTLAAS